MVIDIRPFFQKQFGKLGLSIGHRRPECLAAKLVHSDPGLLQHLDILRALAPAHFLESPLFLLRAEFCGLSSKEGDNLRPAAAGGGEQQGLFLCQTGISSMLQQEVDHRHIIPKNRDLQWHQLDVFAELDGNIQIQTALEQRLQLGSVMVTDGGSRFREGLPAANICNLVHKAPAFSTCTHSSPNRSAASL